MSQILNIKILIFYLETNVISTKMSIRLLWSFMLFVLSENLLNDLQGGLKEQYANFISQVKQEMQEKSIAIEAEVLKIKAEKEEVEKKLQEVETKTQEVTKKEEEVKVKYKVNFKVTIIERKPWQIIMSWWAYSTLHFFSAGLNWNDAGSFSTR